LVNQLSLQFRCLFRPRCSSIIPILIPAVKLGIGRPQNVCAQV
jgi:hypothetical protein